MLLAWVDASTLPSFSASIEPISSNWLMLDLKPGEERLLESLRIRKWSTGELFDVHVLSSFVWSVFIVATLAFLLYEHAITIRGEFIYIWRYVAVLSMLILFLSISTTYTDDLSLSLRRLSYLLVISPWLSKGTCRFILKNTTYLDNNGNDSVNMYLVFGPFSEMSIPETTCKKWFLFQIVSACALMAALDLILMLMSTSVSFFAAWSVSWTRLTLFSIRSISQRPEGWAFPSSPLLCPNLCRFRHIPQISPRRQLQPNMWYNGDSQRYHLLLVRFSLLLNHDVSQLKSFQPVHLDHPSLAGGFDGTQKGFGGFRRSGGETCNSWWSMDIGGSLLSVFFPVLRKSIFNFLQLCSQQSSLTLSFIKCRKDMSYSGE